MTQQRPHILYLHTHDIGRYIEPHGYAIPTPNLMHLARQSQLFRHAHAAAPTCSPSRVALLTGQSPHTAGCYGLTHRGWGLAHPERHLANVLSTAGYSTALSGVQHEHQDPRAIGYQHLLKEEEAGKSIEDAASAFIKRQHDKPFFLAVGFGDTHRSFPDPLPADDEAYCRPPETLPDNATTRRDMATFRRAAAQLDARMGRVLQSLDDAGLRNNTLVICTTDHGIAFPHMKCQCTDHGTGVFLMLRWPGHSQAGAVSDGLVSHIDIVPTLCETLHIPIPDWVQGTSLRPLFDNPNTSVNEAVFSEVTYHAAAEPQRSIRTDRWRFIIRYDERLRPVGTNTDVSLSKEYLVANGWSEQRYQREELYDCVFDPQQRHNVADDPRHADVLADLRGQLQTWMQDTDDMLLQGPVPLADDSLLADPDDFHTRVGG